MQTKELITKMLNQLLSKDSSKKAIAAIKLMEIGRKEKLP